MPFSKSPFSAFLLTLLLTGLAGFVDAISYLHLNGLYVSFMSGNTISLGAEITTQHSDKAEKALQLIGLFLAGVVVGTSLALATGRWHAPFVLAFVSLLLLSAYAWPSKAAVGMTLAMGMLNSAVHKIGGMTVSLTFITGSIVRFGTGLANWISGQTEDFSWLWQCVSWLGLLVGAIAGAQVLLHFGLLALLISSMLAFFLMLYTAIVRQGID